MGTVIGKAYKLQLSAMSAIGCRKVSRREEGAIASADASSLAGSTRPARPSGATSDCPHSKAVAKPSQTTRNKEQGDVNAC